MNATVSPKDERFDPAELGAMMREVRENLGYDLESVSKNLRIRLVYLEAIERGRLSDLPGNAYVSGFLRAYSEHLGLDGEEIYRRFQLSGVDISNKTQLLLPSPIEEGRLPTTFILMIAVVIAASAYGGWYFLSGNHNGSLEEVSKVPAKLSNKDKNKEEPVFSSNTSAKKKVKQNRGGVNEKKLIKENDLSSDRQSGDLKTSDSPNLKTSNGALSPINQSKKENALKKPLVQNRQPVVRTSTYQKKQSKENTLTSPLKTDLSKETSATGQIVLRAVADTYVVVRTSYNTAVFSKLMRAEDSYEVPSGQSLFLETGNAGGLQVFVDGRRAPSLGPSGKVRRNIQLNAESLLKGPKER